MTRAMHEELKQISTEMRTITHRSEQDPRQMDQETQDRLEQLTADMEALMSDTIYHGYGS